MSFVAPFQVLRRGVLSGRGGARHSAATRVLHFLLLLSVSGQLASSQFMSGPEPGKADSGLLLVHEYAGLGSFGLIFVFWLWVLIRHGETRIGRLFPWFSSDAVHAVIQDALSQVRGILQWKHVVESDGALASAIHGLGLLTVTAMAISGTLYFFMASSVFASLALEIHSIIANLMWVYLFGHAGMALLHHLLGNDVLSRMFGIRRGRIATVEREEAESR